MNPDVEAIVVILASVTAMAFADAIVKYLSNGITLWQIFACRSVAAIAIVLLMVRFSGIRLSVNSATWITARSSLLALTWLCYYASLPLLSLSVASVAVYTGQIFIVLFAGMAFGEQVRLRQWAGVFVGFAGVVAISKPGTEAFSWATLLPLLGAAFYAASILMTRAKCQKESAFTLSLGLSASLLVTGLAATLVLAVLDPSPAQQATFPFLLSDWATLSVWDWGVLSFLGLLFALHSAGVARAYQVGTASVVATFDYAYLVPAALWGFLFFSEVPDVYTAAGMILITAAGLLVTKNRKSHLRYKAVRTAQRSGNSTALSILYR